MLGGQKVNSVRANLAAGATTTTTTTNLRERVKVYLEGVLQSDEEWKGDSLQYPLLIQRVFYLFQLDHLPMQYTGQTQHKGACLSYLCSVCTALFKNLRSNQHLKGRQQANNVK